MPYCQVYNAHKTFQIFYRTYGHGPTKVLLLIGMAALHEAWMPQIRGLTGSDVPNDDEDNKSTVDNDDDISHENGIQVCGLDNRGAGRSSVPTDKSDYSMTIMAKDAIAIMDHLGWKKAHVFGHSMGSMIAQKLAALVPDRVLSLALINIGGGGMDILPKPCFLAVSVYTRLILAKMPQKRARAELDLHFSQEYLDESVGPNTRRSILYQEYVTTISKTGMQTQHAFLCQFGACFRHRMTQQEFEQIRSGGFPVTIIHGRQDVVAPVSRAKRLAENMYPSAKLVEVQGAHLVIRERVNEVNDELFKLIKASESKMSLYDWTNLSTPSQDSIAPRMLIYFFGAFAFLLQYVRRLAGGSKPVKVGSSD